MPRRTPEPLQQYRGTTAQHAAYTGPVGEITVDTTKKTAVVHDGVTAGGHPLAKESTTITASNGVEISAGGTLGQNTTVSGVSASTSAPGVVQLNNATDSTAQNQAATPKAVSDALQAAKDYADTAGAPYTGAAPISVDANTREISVADATASTKGVVSVGTNLNVTNGAVSVATASTTAKGVMQVGDNMTVNGGVVSVKPWTDYAANHTTVDPTTLQEDAIVVTDESIGYPTAVLAEIEQTISGDPSKVPSSAAFRAVVETWHNGTEWYRKWSDGWIEQGGVDNNTNAIATINLNKPFSDVNYTVVITCAQNVLSTTAYDIGAYNKTTTTFTRIGINSDGSANNTTNWYACGY